MWAYFTKWHFGVWAYSRGGLIRGVCLIETGDKIDNLRYCLISRILLKITLLQVTLQAIPLYVVRYRCSFLTQQVFIFFASCVLCPVSNQRFPLPRQLSTAVLHQNDFPKFACLTSLFRPELSDVHSHLEECSVLLTQKEDLFILTVHILHPLLIYTIT